MEHEETTRPHRQILWGVALMALGGLFLLDKTGVVEMPSIWNLWPAVLLVMGVCRLIARRPGSGATLILLGLAFFAAEFAWMGLSYSTFWPLLFVAIGVGMVIKAFSREEECCKSDEECCKDDGERCRTEEPTRG